MMTRKKQKKKQKRVARVRKQRVKKKLWQRNLQQLWRKPILDLSSPGLQMQGTQLHLRAVPATQEMPSFLQGTITLPTPKTAHLTNHMDQRMRHLPQGVGKKTALLSAHGQDT
uniref:Uncharacterized protein n=1 Tax=Cacopsylla melanoneura TaxID=428564 RepID=A0A8D8T8Z0_9HEMI